MIKELKEAFQHSQYVPLQVVKKCQIYPGEGWHFLTNRSNHPLSAYEVLRPEFHLNPGNVVVAVGFKHAVGNDKKIASVKVRRADGLEFEIFTSDLKRFVQIVDLSYKT